MVKADYFYRLFEPGDVTAIIPPCTETRTVDSNSFYEYRVKIDVVLTLNIRLT